MSVVCSFSLWVPDVGDAVLTSVEIVKYLGVILSSDMSWYPLISTKSMPRLENSSGYSTTFLFFVHLLHLSHFILLSFVLIWKMGLLSGILISAKTLTS